jgi:hypothetical protein
VLSNKSKTISIIYLLFSIVLSSEKVLFFDLGEHDKDIYRPFFKIAESSGLDIEYVPISKIIDSKSPIAIGGKSRLAFFNLNIEFLKGFSSPVAKKAMLLLKNWSNNSGVTTVLMFPAAGSGRDKVKTFSPIFKTVGLVNDGKDDSVSQKKMKGLINAFLASSMEMRGFGYHTTLNSPRNGASANFPYPEVSNSLLATPMPFVKNSKSGSVAATMPFGVYWRNNDLNNHLVVSSSVIPSFSGITENFQFFPTDVELQKEIHEKIGQFLWELKSVVTSGESEEGFPAKKIVESVKPPLGSLFDEFVKKTELKVDGEKIAWMETTLFERESKLSDDDEARIGKKEDKLIDYIVTSKIDSLWLSFSPNMYYSPIGKHRAKKGKMILGLSRFTKKLSEAVKKRKAFKPKIWVGFEIVNNLVDGNEPKKFSKDLFGSSYTDIPQPLDNKFWEQEVFRPLQLFVKDWQDRAVSNGVELGGVVLDLEMYGRKSTGSFLGTMGFGESCSEGFEKPEGENTVNYLLTKQLMGSYYSFIEGRARELGLEFRKKIKKIIPRGRVCCYMPNIILDWFYKGLCRGLGTSKDPVHLLTFDCRFDLHKDILKSKKIHAVHSSVLLLSKLKSEVDFSWVDDILHKNSDQNGRGGVWLNRYSRMVEDYKPNEWYTVEQSPMSDGLKMKFSSYLGIA